MNADVLTHVQSLFEKGSHSWVPNTALRSCTWNARSAFPADLSRARCKAKGLKSLLLKHDIVAIQESHLARKSVHAVRKLAEDCGTFVFGHFHSQASGGIILFVRKTFLENNFEYAFWEETVSERVGRLRCGGKHGLAEFWNIHLYPTTDPARVSCLDKIQKNMHAQAFTG